MRPESSARSTVQTFAIVTFGGQAAKQSRASLRVVKRSVVTCSSNSTVKSPSHLQLVALESRCNERGKNPSPVVVRKSLQASVVQGTIAHLSEPAWGGSYATTEMLESPQSDVLPVAWSEASEKS